jgi:phospholipid/cholesterol/gamma-HCH transport system substrate-binding protein
VSLLATKKDRLYTAITGLIIIGAVLLGVFLTSGGTSHTIYARFKDAEFIEPGNTVHVNGVTEGKVVSMKVDQKTNEAIVKLSLTKDAWPIHSDATASIRPISILGEQYVDMSTGTAGGKVVANGWTVPVSQTTSATNLQSVLNSVTDPTATSLATLISSLGQGFAGEGGDAQDAIKALAPAMTNTAGLVKLVNSQNQLLNSMIDNVTPVLHSLDTNQGQSLNDLVSTTNNLLGATAQSSANMGQDLNELPGTLNAATNTFNQLGNLSDQATPVLSSLTPLTGNLNAVSHEVLNFSQAANPAVTSLTPLLSQAQTLINKATPVVNELQATGPQGLQDLQNGETILHGNVADLTNFYSFIAEWASTTGDYDATSHYFRFHAQADCAAVPVPTAFCPQAAPAAKPAAATPVPVPAPTPALPATPVPEPQVPNVGGIINNILNQPAQIVPNVVGGLLGGGNPANANGSATGLTPGQEQNMLGYLLGGS